MGFDGSDIDELLNRATATGAVHGVAASVVDRDGVLYAGHAGAAGRDTVFRNASMTKAVATTAALQLVEQRALELDATVASILPAFGQLQVLEGFDGDRPVLRAPTRQATVRQLMNHTSGLGYFFFNAELMRYQQAHGIPGVLQGKRAGLMLPLASDPGTRWEYGVSVDWLGLVVEELTGQTLGAYLAEHIYGPLGMVDSTFNRDEVDEARLLELRMRAADGTLQPTALDIARNPDWDAGGHGSFGTIQDYSRFIRSWLRDGELDGARILSPETCELAFEDHLGGAELPEVMRSLVPELSNDVPTLPVAQGWGLGFHLTAADIPGMRAAGTGDWAGIFNSYFWIDRSRGIGAVIMTQIVPFFDAKVIRMLMEFELAAYRQTPAASTAAGDGAREPSPSASSASR